MPRRMDAAQPRARLVGEDLAELLSGLADAPECRTASAFLLEQLADAAGAERAVLLLLDPERQLLSPVARHGLSEHDAPRAAVSLDEEEHPFIISLTGLDTVVCDGSVHARVGLPFARWVALPLPQPRYRGSPPLREPRAVSFRGRYGGCGVYVGRGQRRRQLGHAPFGVVVLEGEPDESTLESLVNTALLAGPIMARMFAVEKLRGSAARLDEQRNLLAAIMNALSDPIVITDASNDVVVQNSRAEFLLTPKESDSEGRRRAVEINNLLFSSFLSKTVMAGGVEASSRELNLVDPDEGSDLLFEVLAHPLPPSIGPEGAHLSVLRDVTDLKRAAVELERQYQRLRLTEQDATRERDRLNLILNNVGDPILVTDEQTNIVLMNPQAERLFEVGAADERNRVLAQRVRGNDTKFTTLVSDFAVSPALYRRQQVSLIEPRSGTELPMEVVSGKIVNERGEPMAIVSVLHDLTKQVENERLYTELKRFSGDLEDRIRIATADLEEQNLRLQWQSSELEKAYRLKSEFLANMSHELRTPINALIGYTALMLDRIYGDLTAKQEEGLLRIQVSSQHLLALINDILDLAKIEAGKMPIHLDQASLKTIVAEIGAQIEPMVRKKSLEFRCSVDEDIPQLTTDRTKIRQIVLNLLSNAVKFTHRGSVSLVATLHGDRVRIEVADTGIGIKPEHLDVIFEEFRQVDQSRTREYGGTGLGLSITRKLIALLGGEIEVRSEYGAGTTFVVMLPVRSEPMSTEEQVTRLAMTTAHTRSGRP